MRVPHQSPLLLYALSLRRNTRRFMTKADTKSILSMPPGPSGPLSYKACKQHHAQLITSGAISDIFLANSLLNYYSRFGDLYVARRVFDQMPLKNVVSWTVVISAYVHHESFDAAVALFMEMIWTDEKPNQFTLSVAIHAFANLGTYEMGYVIHGLLIRSGLEGDPFVGSSLMNMYLKMGFLDSAAGVFGRLFRRDLISWNIMIAGFSQGGHVGHVSSLFSRVRLEGMTPNDFTCMSLLKCCCISQDVEQIHAFAFKIAMELDVFLGSALADAYFKCNNIDAAQIILCIMPQNDEYGWSSAISGYVRNRRGEQAFMLYRNMCRQGVKPDQHALSGALKGCLDMPAVDAGMQIHGIVIKDGYEKNCYIASVLLDLYSYSNRMADAEKVFVTISTPDIVLWNSLITCYAQMADYAPMCLNTFREFMQTGQATPNDRTIVGVLKSCQSVLDLTVGHLIHTLVIKSIHGSAMSVGNAVINMYAKCGSLEEACKAFIFMIQRDGITWSTIIEGFVESGLELEAIRVWKHMNCVGLHLSEFSFTSCLSGCSKMAAMCLGIQFHCLSLKAGVIENVHVGSSVIDMYAKCGSIDDSSKAFKELKKQNIVSFNAYISGLAQHGRADEVFHIFKELVNMGMAPNEMTFIGILTACSNAGLVEESIRVFDIMQKIYGLAPDSEHYCCLINVFCGAGKLSEAYQMACEWQIHMNASVWRAMLNACLKHGNMILGEKAAKKLLQLQPGDHASYVLLSNIYSKAEEWREAFEVREKMSKMGVQKDRGNSWMIIQDNVHEFVAGEFSHPKMSLTMIELKTLHQLLKITDTCHGMLAHPEPDIAPVAV